MQSVLLQVTFDVIRRQFLGVIHHFQYRFRGSTFQAHVKNGRDKITM